jgi:D-alanyl-D-alanine carboxypeptidase
LAEWPLLVAAPRKLAGLAVLGLVLLAAPAAVTATSAAPPRFVGVVSPIPASYRARMTSWQTDCPVRIENLRLIRVSHWDFDGRVRRGELVVNTDAVAPILSVLRALFASRFPMRRMRLVEAYGSDDDRSMAADNTSAFNCRRIPGSRGSWSQHAFGRAIDVNPLENPEVRNGVVSPPGGRVYANRSRQRKGMIRANDEVVRAFAAVGWRWGGHWRSLKDYQHFSANGL